MIERAIPVPEIPVSDVAYQMDVNKDRMSNGKDNCTMPCVRCSCTYDSPFDEKHTRCNCGPNFCGLVKTELMLTEPSGCHKGGAQSGGVHGSVCVARQGTDEERGTCTLAETMCCFVGAHASIQDAKACCPTGKHNEIHPAQSIGGSDYCCCCCYWSCGYPTPGKRGILGCNGGYPERSRSGTGKGTTRDCGIHACGCNFGITNSPQREHGCNRIEHYCSRCSRSCRSRCRTRRDVDRRTHVDEEDPQQRNPSADQRDIDRSDNDIDRSDSDIDRRDMCDSDTYRQTESETSTRGVGDT